MHKMYKVAVGGGRTFAVKHLNPKIMKRPGVFENYVRAEKIEGILEQAEIPIVPALCFDGKKMQELDGNYFYIFNWHDAKITDWDNITDEQCFLAGNTLGRIHSIVFDLEEVGVEKSTPELSHIDWKTYADQAIKSRSEIAGLLQQNLELLDYAQAQLNNSRHLLPEITCISDEDMDPKNVMWENGKPLVISPAGGPPRAGGSEEAPELQVDLADVRRAPSREDGGRHGRPEDVRVHVRD